jgi:hypothetical protein
MRLALVNAHPGRNLQYGGEAMPMSFSIERLAARRLPSCCVCGRMRIECVNTIKELIEAENTKAVLDLSEVTLADHDAATFLAVCE